MTKAQGHFFQAALLFIAAFLFYHFTRVNINNAPDGCSVENVQISDIAQQQIDPTTVLVTGKIRHSCNVAVGIEVELTATYKDGSIAFIKKLWPASDANIPPNTDFHFSLYEGVAGEADKITAIPTDIDKR